MFGLVYIFIFSLENVFSENNVCKYLNDYKTIQINQNCWYNPDFDSTPEDIVVRYGYETEKYFAQTEDGYSILLYRIIKNGYNSLKSRQPIIMQYGIGGSTELWLLQENNSLPFFLFENGFDVWLTNYRGKSKEIQKLSKNDPNYWNYDFHEMGIYDLPAIIDFISKITNYQEKLIYIGHSMGSTMSYVYAIEKSMHAHLNIKGFISLAPIMYMENLNEIFQVSADVTKIIQDITSSIGLYVLGPQEWFHELITNFCTNYPTILICKQTQDIFSGKSVLEDRPDLFPVFMTYYPSVITIKSLIHYLQIIRNKKFVKFDYGLENIQKYNTTTPPEYDVNKITVPVHLFTGTNDNLSSIPDVEKLYKKLKQNGIETTMHIYDYAHNDFYTARHYKQFYKDLLNVLTINLK